MNSKFGIDSKIGADAINHGSPGGNLNSNVTNANPLLKDSKRVIKKMIVMDTSKLKGLGIESTVKDAMSKLGKGKSVKIEKPMFEPVNAQPMHTSSQIQATVIKSELEPNGITVKSAETVVKHIHRQGVPFSATSKSMTDQVPVQPKSMKVIPPRQSVPTPTTSVSFQSSKSMTPPVPAIKNVIQGTCTSIKPTNSIQPMIITSTTVPIVKLQHNGPIQNNCNAKIVPSPITNISPVIKLESAVPSAASDGKKIKVLSNVSLADGKSKLLEIDKLASKNLKFTNVIKGTDKSSPKVTVHQNTDSVGKPELTSHSSAVSEKAETDKVPKFTHVIKGSDQRQPRATVCTSNATRPPVFLPSSVPKPIQTEIKLTSSMNLKPLNVHDMVQQSTQKQAAHPGNLTSQHAKSFSIPARPSKIEKQKFASKNLKMSTSADASVKPISPKILNFSNVIGGNSLNSGFMNQSVRPAPKPTKTGVDTVPSKNSVFTNASKPAVQFITSTRKSTMPPNPSPAPTKIEVEIKLNDFNQPHGKASKEFPLHNVVKPPACKVTKPVTSTSSTSAATEVTTKQLVTTDDNVEVYKPCAQKYLIKSSSTDTTAIDNARKNKRLHDSMWSSNNPRTYARHNIKRLLSDKIIKKSRSQEENAQHVQNEQTSEWLSPPRSDKYDGKSDVKGYSSTVACDSESEKVKPETEPLTDQSASRASVPTAAEVTVQSTDQKPVQLLVQPPSQPMDVKTDSEKVKFVSLKTEPLCNQSTPSKSVPIQAYDPVQNAIQPKATNRDSVSASKNNFCGFSIDEVNASSFVLSQIKAIVSKKRRNETQSMLISSDSKVGNEKEAISVACNNDKWILNYETGVLEEKIARDVEMATIQPDVPQSTTAAFIMGGSLSQSNSVNQSTPKKLPSPQILQETELESVISGFSPLKIPVIEDADDEISDIDLVHRSKTKCAGSTINRRAILKSIELHRKAFLTATTDDDESELSLHVRPPRPKLRKVRQKQSLEQLKVQQSAHISLLKRFTQTDPDNDNLDGEALMRFIDRMESRIEMLQNQVKCCFKRVNVGTNKLSEQSVPAYVDPTENRSESVKPSESVTENNEVVQPSESSSTVHSKENCAVSCEPQLHAPNLPLNAETADSEHRQGQLTIHEITIQKDTYLVTEYDDNQCDKINHLPLNVKIERETFTKPTISVHRSPAKKTTKPTIRKKRKRKSLVEMLAKHVDQETLKSVIIAHANQKCDHSSSVDSESGSDSDDHYDVVSKIFRTVCTIDLCDDDDETVHDDVLQYLKEPEGNEIDIQHDEISVIPSHSNESEKNHEPPEPNEPHQPSYEKSMQEEKESEPPEASVKTTNTCSTTVIASDNSIEDAQECDPSSKNVKVVADLRNEKTSLSTLATSISLRETESKSPKSFDNEHNMEINATIDVEPDPAPPTGTLPSPEKTVVEEVNEEMDVEPNPAQPTDTLPSTEKTVVEEVNEEMDVERNPAQPTDTLPSTEKTVVEEVNEEMDVEPNPAQPTDTLPSRKKTIVEEVNAATSIKAISQLGDMSGKSVTKNPKKNIFGEVEAVAPSDVQLKLDEIASTSITKNPAKATSIDVNDDVLMGDISNVADKNDTNVSKGKDLMDVEVSPSVLTDRISKLEDIHKSIEVKNPVIKLRPFEEISKPKSRNNFVMESSAGIKLSFEETLSKADSVICKKSKSKRKTKVPKIIGPTEIKSPDNSIDSNQNNSRLNIVPETSTKSTEQTSNDKIQFSSVSLTGDSAVGPIKIKIKIGRDSQGPNNSALNPNNETVNSVPKSRSRKRKSEVLEDSVSTAVTPTPIPSKTTRKRPIFDYFEAPEILTTKRARKSKSHVDDDIPIENVPTKIQPSSSRTSKRKSNVSKVESVLPKVESNVQKNVEEATDQKDILTTEPIEPVSDPKANVLQTLQTPKSGRGIKPPVLPPINIADKYVCGNCKEEVEAKNWTKHMKSHYGLAWRVDVDPPIDMDNIHSMSSKVINFTKKANIKILKCQKCDVEKKSALGYLSHMEICGLTPEEVKSKLVKCEYCPSMIRNCSMKIHLTFCAGLKRLLQKEKESSKEAESTEECYNDMGRAVRLSAQKAMSSFKDLGKPPEAKLEDYVERVEKISNKQHRKWRQLLKDNSSIECVRKGCEFTADDMVSMVNHFNSCVLIDGETFYCNRCEHGPDTRAVVEEHIKASHSLGIIDSIDDKVFSDSDDDAELGEESSESEGDSGDEEISEKDGEMTDYDDEDDDGWNAKGYKKRRQRDWPHNEVLLNSCLDRKVLLEHSQLLKSYTGGSYFHLTLEWTQDFRDKHFSSEALLPLATPNKFSVLCSTLTHLYLPRVQTSNTFLVKEVNKYRKVYGSTEISKSDKWTSLKRFEAKKDGDCIVLFAGGPVLSMAWLPVPDDHLSQILAVCCRRDANDDILLNNTKAVKCLIQIWNFHKLSNGQMRQAQIPHLLYSVAYDHGPVIQMEFCPSGGFTEDRLGLLAVSSYDGHVDILALPKNFTCDNSEENLVFTIEPSLTLCCERDRPFGVLMTKLVWSQSKGHTKLAGGFSNGLVAIWNLKNLDAPFTCSEINGIPTLLPTDLFFAGNKTIRLLEFHHDEKNEARWLIAGSHDRKVKFFDTHNVYLEISTTMAHSRIVAGCWPIHWTSFLLGIDNAYSLKVSGIIVKQPLDIGCRTSTFYSCIGSTCDISFNNWLNSYVFVTSYGDIHVGYVRQMISGFGEARRHRSILGYTDSVKINRSDSNEGDGIANDEVSASDEQQPSTSSATAIEEAADVSYPSADGIVFCDFKIPLPAVTSPSYEKIGAPPMNTYNIVKVNRIVFNPNVSAYKLYALGYESGFVRVNQLLPK